MARTLTSLHESDARLAQYVADDTINLLAKQPEVIAEIKTLGDFVFVEETTSLALSEMPDIDPDTMNVACGLVFAWLEKEHAIAPPTWYVEWMNA